MRECRFGSTISLASPLVVFAASLIENSDASARGITMRLENGKEKTMKDPEVKKKMDQNGFKTEFLSPEASLALVKKKMVEYEAIMKELGRLKK